MASAKLRRNKAASNDKFLTPEQTRTIKPADFRNYTRMKELTNDDLMELLFSMEAELQAKDVLLKALLSSKEGTAVPLSHLMNDVDLAKLGGGNSSSSSNSEITGKNKSNQSKGYADEDDDEIWLGEPSAHLNHVVAYHQVVREQMQSTVNQLQKAHKEVVEQLDDECNKHAADTAHGDDVTYMLEKERERLQKQIDCEQMKYADLENERDALRAALETERREYYNTFNELVGDCKALAEQLVQQSTKYQKETDKERHKNKVLSELMVEETKRFKEKLRKYEKEVNDFYVLEKKKTDLEERLAQSDKQVKETFHQLNEERQRNAKLHYEINQLRKQFPPINNHGYHHHMQQNTEQNEDEEDILLVQNKIEIPVKEARNSTIQLSLAQDMDRDSSPEPSTVLPPAVPTTFKLATVQKSSSVRQSKGGYPSPQQPSSKPGMVISASAGHHTMRTNNSFTDNNTNIATVNPKRNSYEEKRSYTNNSSISSTSEPGKRNSLEGNLNSELMEVEGMVMKRNCYDEPRLNSTSANTIPKRNSYEGDNKKIPPPAPPRRGSTLTPQDRPPIVKIPQQLQLRNNKSNSMQQRQGGVATSPTTTDSPML